MKEVKHWQDLANLAIGAWLCVCPWVLGIQAETAAVANFVAIGVLLAAAALGAVFAPHEWEEWITAGLGLWLIASPWALGFSGGRESTANAIVAGIAVLLLALWVLLTDRDYRGGEGGLRIR